LQLIGKKLGIESNILTARRITDDATIDLVTMVYGGLLIKKLLHNYKFVELQCNWLTGADGNISLATKRAAKTSTSAGLRY